MVLISDGNLERSPNNKDWSSRAHLIFKHQVPPLVVRPLREGGGGGLRPVHKGKISFVPIFCSIMIYNLLQRFYDPVVGWQRLSFLAGLLKYLAKNTALLLQKM